MAEGAAIAALNAFSAGQGRSAREQLGLGSPGDAIDELASAAADGALRVPRLFVLDSLVKLAGRRGELDAYGEQIDRLLEGLARDAGVSNEAVGDAVVTARGALDSVAAQGAKDEPTQRWPAFAEKAAGALRLSRAEMEKPQCNDAGVVRKAGREARGVTVEFHSDMSPGELRHFCDPTRWHEVSAFQHEMTPWRDRGAVAIERPGGWRRDLVETVDLTPAKTLVTPLRFTYSIDDAADPGWVHLDYVLLAETEDIAVDEGALDVRRVTGGEQRGRTRVSAKKAIFFTDPLFQEWTTVACDTFWTDTVIAAAVDSAGFARGDHV